MKLTQELSDKNHLERHQNKYANPLNYHFKHWALTSERKYIKNDG